MKAIALKLLVLLSMAAFVATNVSCAFANNGCIELQLVQVSEESGISMSITEIFILVFCFLFAAGLVLLWQFCFRKKH
jgi:hypothetical protein